ncbi:unnamed protein product [Cuscuta epithymum]|uniref:Uncharacterized protein n=1 Tax=Cuscuta epithymum TaxID=186058 RepID=A0AAV0CX21_9ASTE|nr:unnamed protein product [Cuscuta epithymum]
MSVTPAKVTPPVTVTPVKVTTVTVTPPAKVNTHRQLPSTPTVTQNYSGHCQSVSYHHPPLR